MMKLRVRFAQTHGMGAWTPELCALPACLADARKLALARQLAEAHAAEPELAIDGVGTPTTLAAALLARRELRLAVRLDDHRCLSHKSSFIVHLDRPGLSRARSLRYLAYSALNGKWKASRSALPSSSVGAVVTIVMSMPRVRSILSKSISGKISCSVTPME